MGILDELFRRQPDDEFLPEYAKPELTLQEVLAAAQALTPSVPKSDKPADPLRWAADAIGQNKDLPAPAFFMDPRSLSMRNIVHSGLNTAANWLDGTKDPRAVQDQDMIAPLGLGGMGGIVNSMTRPGRDFRIADDLARQHPGASPVGDIPRFAPIRDASNPTGAAYVADFGSMPDAPRAPMNSNAGGVTIGTRDIAPGHFFRVTGADGQTVMAPNHVQPAINATIRAGAHMDPRVASRYAAEATNQNTRGPYAVMADNAKGSAPGTVLNSLDMSEAARKARATEQGFDETTYYKGHYPYSSGGPITDVYGKVKSTSPYVLKDELSGFFSANPEVANKFTGLGGWFDNGAVAPVRLRYSNPLEIDAQGKHAAAVQFDQIAKRDGMMDELDRFRTAFDKGHDAVIIRNTKDEGDIIRIKDPQQVRSTQAAFDPAKRDSSKLLAASPSASAPGLAANSTQQPKDASQLSEPALLELLRRLEEGA